jgi:hypothetical protein
MVIFISCGFDVSIQCRSHAKGQLFTWENYNPAVENTSGKTG